MGSKFTEEPEDNHAGPSDSIHGAAGVAGDKPLDVVPEGNTDEASSTDHVHEKPAPAVPLTKRQKVQRHCGRFKWWYIGVIVVILIILIPLIFTRIIPAVVQDIVRQQKFPIIQGTFQAVSPTQLAVTLETQLDTPVAATIDSTILSLYNKDAPEFSPFLNVTLPKMNVDHKTPVAVEKQIVDVVNEPELVRWFDRVYEQTTTDLSVKGKATVHLGALKMGASIDKTLATPSLNKLQGFGIEKLTLLLPPKEDGTNMKGKLNLPNSGVLGLGLGNVTFNIHSGDINLGYLTVTDVLLNPGNNTPSFFGRLYLDEILPNLGAILDSQSAALADGNIDLKISGNATVVNGKHIGYVEQVLNKKTIIAAVPVTRLIGDIISSFSTGEASVTALLGDAVGNSTFIEGLLDNWKPTPSLTGKNSTAVSQKHAQRSAPRTIKAAATKNLLKLGLKMALAKL